MAEEALAATTKLRSEKDGNVDAMDDSGYFARFEEPQPQHRGVNAGVHLGTRQM